MKNTVRRKKRGSWERFIMKQIPHIMIYPGRQAWKNDIQY